MPRVLLLPSEGVDAETARLRAAIRSRLRARETAPVAGHVALLLRQGLLLRRAVRDAEVVHAIGTAALAAAIMGGARRTVFQPVAMPTRRLTHWLRAIGRHRDLRVVASSDAARRRLVTGGVPADRCTLIRPGVDLGALPVRRDDALRAALGFAADDVVMLAPLEEPHTSGRAMAFWATSLLNVLDPRYKLLLTRGGVAHPADDLRERLIDSSACVVADLRQFPVEKLFAGSDYVLLPATGPVSMSTVAMAMASGRPVIATATPQICELLEDRHTALLVGELSPRLLAQRVLDAAGDPQQSAKIADRARSEVYELLTQAKAVELYRQLYDLAARS
ncbi:MAG TPA: glycosyltransferase [Tepidisphaeraceae bacterium]|jgi:glycosyltransferase involved in cell wall biosynthesis